MRNKKRPRDAPTSGAMVNLHSRFTIRSLAAVAATLAVLACTPAAGATEFHLIGFWPGAAKVEAAIQTQVNTQVAKHWAIAPLTFGATGEPVSMIGSSAKVAIDCGYPVEPKNGIIGGCHGGGSIWVGPLERSTALSHEVIEEAVDPSATGEEICDAVENSDYTINGVAVSDFLYPSYFTAGAAGPWDQMHVIRRDHNLTYTGSLPPAPPQGWSRMRHLGHGTGIGWGGG